jgi:thiamine-phosphate diphosphorylase
MITRDYPAMQELIVALESAIAKGINLIQFRAHALNEKEYLGRFYQIQKLCSQNHVTLIANTSVENAACCDGDGLHLSSQRLMACQQRPVSRRKWLGASVHNEAQLRHALSIEVDYVVLSPVKPTASHPDTVPLGWELFDTLTKISSVPVFALGGMVAGDLPVAIAHGGQGIAGISLFD